MSKPRRLASLRTGSQLIVAAAAGVVAGTIATAVQMLAWWLSATPVLQTLLRDARLTAAIVMGPAVLTSAPVLRWDLLLIAALIHLSLSFAYAAIAMLFVRRLNAKQAIATGAAYGLAIYGLNLHALTVFFPWFSVSRGWITMLAHVAFGASLTAACCLFGAAGGRSPSLRSY